MKDDEHWDLARRDMDKRIIAMEKSMMAHIQSNTTWLRWFMAVVVACSGSLFFATWEARSQNRYLATEVSDIHTTVEARRIEFVQALTILNAGLLKTQTDVLKMKDATARVFRADLERHEDRLHP